MPRSQWGGINRHAVIWRDISCRKHFGYVCFFLWRYLCLYTMMTPNPDSGTQPTLLNSTKPAQLNPTDRTHTNTTQPTLPNPSPTTNHPPTTPTPPTTQKVLCTFAFAPRPPPPPTPNPPCPPHLPPRRYYAPLPSPPDHHDHHHPTHPAHPTYHPEGTMHLCLRPPTTTTTTTHHHTTQPPPHPPIRDEGVFCHRCVCSIVNSFVPAEAENEQVLPRDPQNNLSFVVDEQFTPLLHCFGGGQ